MLSFFSPQLALHARVLHFTFSYLCISRLALKPAGSYEGLRAYCMYTKTVRNKLQIKTTRFLYNKVKKYDRRSF